MTDRVRTYALQTSIGYIYVRLYESRGFTMAKAVFGVPALTRFPLAPNCCALCDADGIPALLGWVDCFGERRIIEVCSECADCTELELEQRLFDKLGLQSAELPVAAE
jgi:hypothetical protein